MLRPPVASGRLHVHEKTTLLKERCGTPNRIPRGPADSFRSRQGLRPPESETSRDDQGSWPTSRTPLDPAACERGQYSAPDFE
ncbi:hypothetical protein FOTG_14725 [Fusarium oxysporum f. sp. vasinfectum 25433]|uniref:Uncharacterized protein n=1 Tax=Fusarium oxysporum f. sp. vasinfectum 25433 TaxID=1089449 RepID=X0L7H2_FUSOX|nr:hypothetical protein FOTG_14725 [Fusarium oxysporum f. sp. vasinfectum 25433]